MKYVFASHGNLSGGKADFDAVGSLSSLVRFAKLNNLEYKKDYFICMVDYFADGLEPLKKYYDTTMFIADLSTGSLIDYYSTDGFKNIIQTIKDKGNKIIFIDHHPNNDDNIKFFYYLKHKKIFKHFEFFGVDYEQDRMIPIDLKFCAAERVQYYLFKRQLISDDKVFYKIRTYAHDQDFGLRNIEEALNITKVIGSDFNNKKLIDYLSDGIFWNQELETVQQNQDKLVNELCGNLKIKKLEANFNIGGKNFKKDVVYVLMPKDKRLKVSAAAAYIFKKVRCNFIILIQRNPFFSVRIPLWEKDISAAKIANLFGGGGHYGAASARKLNKDSDFPFSYPDENSFKKIAIKLNKLICSKYSD